MGVKQRESCHQVIRGRNKCQRRVESCGFIVNPKWSWLGADGVLEIDEKLKSIEVKCPFSLHKVNDKIKLKVSHPYFYQCQGVMSITNARFHRVLNERSPYRDNNLSKREMV